MKWGLLVKVLLIKYFSEQVVRLNFEFATNIVVVNWFHKVAELLKHICTSTWIKGLFW